MMRYLFTRIAFTLLLGMPAFFYASAGPAAGCDTTSFAIPIGGNTFLTSSAATKDKITASGTGAWTESASIFSTYFKTDQAGTLQLQLVLQALPGESKIKVTVQNQARVVKIPSNTPRVDAGKFKIKAPGYVRVDFQGLSKSGPSYARLKNLVVQTKACQHLSYVRDNEDNRFYWGRRGPSVHLTYLLPPGKDFKWFYSEIEVPLGQDPMGSYFMANGFGEGYFGMQVNSAAERRILFSVWSPFKTDRPSEIPENEKIKLLKKGEGVYTGEFGNEGSGGQSYFRYPWQAGTTYRFLNSVEPDGQGNTIYTAYFFAPEQGQWQLIASFLRPKTHTWYKRPHSFLENFLDTQGHLGRKAWFKNQWARDVAGNWVELDAARFTGDDIAKRGYRADRSGGQDQDRFFLRNGGFFDDSLELGTSFKRLQTKLPPAIDFKALK
ncbi:MAG: DUF3472 domain-containing protein [Adhaeribacter sp.]